MMMKRDKLWLLMLMGCAIPLAGVIVDTVNNQLGANPIEALHIRLGDWALRFLCITLAITPLQKLTKWRGMTEYRQLFGLCAFFYATLHVVVYIVVDQNFMWKMIAQDIIESPYVWFGVIAYLILFALAMTSSKAAKKRLGKNWKKLHRLIYIASGAAIIHYFWQLKGNLAEPVLYLVLLIVLLGFRVSVWWKNRAVQLRPEN